MKIRLFGLELHAGTGLTLTDLFLYMKSNSGAAVNFHGYDRMIYIDDLGEYYGGLLVTIKDQKKFLEVTQSSSSLQFVPRDVTAGSHLADFNFFLIHKNTGRGIYQFYHNSCSVNPFGHLCKKFYDDMKTGKIDQQFNALDKKAQTEKNKASIRKQFAGTLTWSQIVRPENFDALVASLSSINLFSVNISSLQENEPVFRPLALLSKKVFREFKFSGSLSNQSIASHIKNIVRSFTPESARVEGIDADGLEQIIKLTNNPDSFGEFEYDDVTEKMTFTSNEFASSWFMKEILRIANSKPAMFSSETAD